MVDPHPSQLNIQVPCYGRTSGHALSPGSIVVQTLPGRTVKSGDFEFEGSPEHLQKPFETSNRGSSRK